MSSSKSSIKKEASEAGERESLVCCMNHLMIFLQVISRNPQQVRIWERLPENREIGGGIQQNILHQGNSSRGGILKSWD